MFSLRQLSLQYTSPLPSSSAPVTHFTFLELENDPRAYVFLWVARGPISAMERYHSDSSTHSPTHSLAHSFSHSLTHSLTPTHSLTRLSLSLSLSLHSNEFPLTIMLYHFAFKQRVRTGGHSNLLTYQVLATILSKIEKCM